MSTTPEAPKTQNPVEEIEAAAALLKPTDKPPQVTFTYGPASDPEPYDSKKARAESKKIWVPEYSPVTPYDHLIPEPSDRRGRVMAHVIGEVQSNRSYTNPLDEDRPRTRPERIAAWRVWKKMGKLSIKNLMADNLKSLYLEKVTVPDPENPDGTKTYKRVNFRQNWNNLTPGERRKADRDRLRWQRYQARLRRIERGRKVPLTNRRVMGVEQIAAGTELRRDNAGGAESVPDETLIPTEIAIDTRAKFDLDARAPEILKGLSERQMELYGQIAEGREELKDSIDQSLVKLHERDVQRFKNEHDRDPDPIEKACLKVQAVKRVHDLLHPSS